MDTYPVCVGSGRYRIGGASKLILTDLTHHLPMKVGILGCVMIFVVGVKVKMYDSVHIRYSMILSAGTQSFGHIPRTALKAYFKRV
jgi:hypothetical protein